MDSVFFLILRRMRRPLVSLVVVYSVSILGLIIIPGLDNEGNVWHMGIFHAFYFVSFMSTTIGFGEIPYEFTDAQRLWVLFSLYAGVIVWLYSIGTLLSLFRDKAFRQAMTERRFEYRVDQFKEPFYLICGYGETGATLVRELTDRGRHAVVIDHDQERINYLALDNLRDEVPALAANVRDPKNMLMAGLDSVHCAGVVAVTNDSLANLKVALTSKLLNKRVSVISRADSHEVEANMRSFHTDYVVDPYDTFALHLSTALQSPCFYLLLQWLTGDKTMPLSDPVYPKVEGRWILCGYGRFGKQVYKKLRAEGIEVTVIEADPEKTGCDVDHLVVGIGTEEPTLLEAGIDKVVGLVVGTDNDVNNLSIVLTAKEMNPDAFVILRQNKYQNQALADASNADIVMHSSRIVANSIRAALITPLLHEFISLASIEEDSWACELISRILALVEEYRPDIWELTISEEDALAVHRHISMNLPVTLGTLIADAHHRERTLQAIPLLLKRKTEIIMLPGDDTRINLQDRILFCGREGAKQDMQWILQNEHMLAHVMEDESDSKSVLGKLLKRWL